MKVHITTRKKPSAARSGAEHKRIIKGITYVRQQVYSEFDRAWVVYKGKPVFEWVEKDSERDRSRIKSDSGVV